MIRLAQFFSTNLGILILLMAIYTYFSPYYLEVPSWVPSFFLGIVIFFTGLTMKTTAFKEIHHKKKEFIFIILLKWILALTVSIILAHLFFSTNPELAAGLILTSAVPSATAATLYTFTAGGNTSLVIVSSLLDIAISPIVAPLAMLGLETNSIYLSFFDLLQSFSIIVIIPLILGILLQHLFPKLPVQSEHLAKFSSPVSLLIVIHTLTASGKPFIQKEIQLLPVIILVVFLQTVIPLFLSYKITKMSFKHKQDAIAAMFQVSLCNSALAGILALEFLGGLSAIIPVINLIISLAIGAQVANFFSKTQKERTTFQVL